MQIYKIIYLLPLIVLLWSCGRVSQKEYDEILQEYKELKESLDASQRTNLNQAATINKTLSELAEISGNTMLLRGNIENGTAHVKQAEQISNNIKTIKNKISTLEKEIGNDVVYKKIIANLKTIIKEKEIEINSLKKIIENQSTTITKQKSTITEQKFTITEQKSTIEKQGQQISNQQKQLQQAVKTQATLLYQAASEFEQLAENVPDVSRKKNQKKVNEWAINMLSRSLLYYQKSQEYGINASSAISRIQKKITTLRNEN